MSQVIAKFKFSGIRTWMDWQNKKVGSLEFVPVTSDNPENKKFFDATPYGEIKIGTVNQAVIDQLNLGEEYFVIITKEKPAGV